MIGIFYGSTNGNTEHVAEQLAAKLGAAAQGPFNINATPPAQMASYQTLLLGISTWNEGELQDDWDVNWAEVSNLTWTDRKVALFGCGDQIGYPDTFQDAMGQLYQLLYGKGAHLYGYTNPQGYTVNPTSKALVNGWLCGLAIDNDNQPDLTGGRVDAWVTELKEKGFY